MLEKIKNETTERMEKSIESMRNEMKKIRSGKVNPGMLDEIFVEYYGNKVPLKQVANISAPENRLLVVHPWDKTVLTAIEKEIQKSNIGVNPNNDGKLIRLNFPMLTQEERLKLVKIIKQKGEEAKVAVRNIRRDQNENAKKAKNDGHLSEDEVKNVLDDIQKITDSYIKKIDEITEKKEKEILEV